MFPLDPRHWPLFIYLAAFVFTAYYRYLHLWWWCFSVKIFPIFLNLCSKKNMCPIKCQMNYKKTKVPFIMILRISLALTHFHNIYRALLSQNRHFNIFFFTGCFWSRNGWIPLHKWRIKTQIKKGQIFRKHSHCDSYQQEKNATQFVFEWGQTYIEINFLAEVWKDTFPDKATL